MTETIHYITAPDGSVLGTVTLGATYGDDAKRQELQRLLKQAEIRLETFRKLWYVRYCIGVDGPMVRAGTRMAAEACILRETRSTTEGNTDE